MGDGALSLKNMSNIVEISERVMSIKDVWILIL